MTKKEQTVGDYISFAASEAEIIKGLMIELANHMYVGEYIGRKVGVVIGILGEQK